MVVRSAGARVPVARSAVVRSAVVDGAAPVVTAVVRSVDVAVVIVVAVAPVPVRAPARIPELARAPVVFRQGPRLGLGTGCDT